MPKSQYTQKFRKEWLNEPDLKNWLMEKKRGTGESVAQCKFCNCHLSSKLSDLKAHAQTKKHKANVKDTSAYQQPVLPFTPLKKSNEVQMTEGRMALFVAEHTSVLTCDHLNSLCKNCFQDSKIASQIQIRRSKCSGIIKNVLHAHFMDDITQSVGDNHYSLLLDESTDISDTKYLGIAIIYFDCMKKKVVSTFLALTALEECNADGIVNALKETISSVGLDLQKLTGIGTDNASVMVGVNNGVYEKLKTEVPGLVLIRCVCHSLQLAVSAAAAESLPRNLEYLISQTYKWFSFSSSRQAAYKRLYNVINEGHDPLKIVQACQTRWLSIATAVERIDNQWLELETHFDVVRHSEKCYAAEMLHSMYKDGNSKAYIKFLLPILKDVQRVNKSFESNEADATKLVGDLTLLIRSLIQKIVLPTSNIDPLEGNIEEYLDPNPYLGYQFEREVDVLKDKGFPGDEHALRRRCVQFVITLVQEMRRRLPSNVKTLQKMSLLSVHNALHCIKEPLTPLLELLKISPFDIDIIEQQWKDLTLVKWNTVTKTDLFWSEVGNYRDASDCNPFKELADFAMSILTLPHSNAEVERIFSQLNIVKSKLRNRMHTKMANAILAIRAGLRRNEKTCFNYEIPPNVLSKIGTSETYNTSAQSPGSSASLEDDGDDSDLLIL